MGKMKEVFMEQREAETMNGQPSEMEMNEGLEYVHNMEVIHAPGLTKRSISEFADKIASYCESGSISPMEAKLYLKAMECAIEKINEKIKDWVVDDAMKNGQKSFELRGVKVEIGEQGTKYDFTNCGDPVMNDMLERKELLDKAIKEREGLLKAMTETGMQIVHAERVYNLIPPIKRSTTGVKITFPK